MKRVTIRGRVKEIRFFGETVILYVQASAPREVINKVVCFTLTKENCRPALINWAILTIGSKVEIEKYYERKPTEAHYNLYWADSEIIDADMSLA